jgi:hypothetical protein
MLIWFKVYPSWCPRFPWIYWYNKPPSSSSCLLQLLNSSWLIRSLVSPPASEFFLPYTLVAPPASEFFLLYSLVVSPDYEVLPNSLVAHYASGVSETEFQIIQLQVRSAFHRFQQRALHELHWLQQTVSDNRGVTSSSASNIVSLPSNNASLSSWVVKSDCIQTKKE